MSRTTKSKKSSASDGLFPESREALEAIQDSSNQEEAVLLARVHGLTLKHPKDEVVSIMHPRGGWVIQLWHKYVRYIPHDRENYTTFPTVTYRGIKRLLRRP